MSGNITSSQPSFKLNDRTEERSYKRNEDQITSRTSPSCKRRTIRKNGLEFARIVLGDRVVIFDDYLERPMLGSVAECLVSVESLAKLEVVTNELPRLNLFLEDLIH